MKLYFGQMASSDRIDAKAELRASSCMADVLEYLTSAKMQAIGDAAGGVEARILVDLRLKIAFEFQDHLRTMKGDSARPNRSMRRKSIEKMLRNLERLRPELEAYQPFLMSMHYEASFYGARGPEPSWFQEDYDNLVDSLGKLEQIIQSIAEFAPIGDKIVKLSIKGFPTDRIENPGTWAETAFAYRMARIYWELTDRKPAFGGAGAGPFQRMLHELGDAFESAYKAIGQPFGPFKRPNRKAIVAACRRFQVPRDNPSLDALLHY